VANKQVKRESASFCLNPYFIVIEGTGVEMTLRCDACRKRKLIDLQELSLDVKQKCRHLQTKK